MFSIHLQHRLPRSFQNVHSNSSTHIPLVLSLWGPPVDIMLIATQFYCNLFVCLKNIYFYKRLHFVCFFLFKKKHSLMGTCQMSLQGQKCQIFLSLWGPRTKTMPLTHPHTHGLTQLQFNSVLFYPATFTNPLAFDNCPLEPRGPSKPCALRPLTLTPWPAVSELAIPGAHRRGSSVLSYSSMRLH